MKGTNERVLGTPEVPTSVQDQVPALVQEDGGNEIPNVLREAIFESIIKEKDFLRSPLYTEVLIKYNSVLVNLFNGNEARDMFLKLISDPIPSSVDKMEYLLSKNPSFITLFETAHCRASFLDRNASREKMEYFLTKNPALVELFDTPLALEKFLDHFKTEPDFFSVKKIEYLLEKNPKLAEIFNSNEAKKMFIHTLEASCGLTPSLFSEYHYEEPIKWFLAKDPIFTEHLNSQEARVTFIETIDLRASFSESRTKFLLEINPDFKEVLKEHISTSFYHVMEGSNFDSFKAHGILLKNIDFLNYGVLIGENINYKDPWNLRLIDRAKQLYQAADNNNIKSQALSLINRLRSLGSVEPADPIEDAGGGAKIDLSNNRLDLYEPNRVNAPKIMRKLFEKYPLTEYQVDQEIGYFKQKDFEGLVNSEWGLGKETWSIAEIIDELCKMRQVHDRLPATIDFKKVLATIICVIRTSGDEQMEHTLTLTLQGLHKCSLGKLLNLLHIVQDNVVEDNSAMSMPEFVSLYETSFEAIKQKYNQDTIAKSVFKWATEVVVGKVVPEKWSAETCKVQGILNESLFELSAREKIASKHYIVLKDQLIPEVVRLMTSNIQLPAPLLSLKEAYESGINLCFEKFIERVLKNPKEMESLFDHAYTNVELNFGNFTAVTFKTVMCLIDADLLGRFTLEKVRFASKFLILLRENFTFSDEVERSLTKMLKDEETHRDYLEHLASELLFKKMLYAAVGLEDDTATAPQEEMTINVAGNAVDGQEDFFCKALKNSKLVYLKFCALEDS